MEGDEVEFLALGKPQISSNWRVTFRFVGDDADSVDYEDYH